jgi:hypothetical protein
MEIFYTSLIILGITFVFLLFRLHDKRSEINK